ncbi:MAG: c-type cytochrome [Bryobacteraceae bacterium]
MRIASFLASAGLLAALPASAQAPQGDASRGRQVFQSLNCVTCHSVRGEGGNSGPALGAQPGQTYTPNTMASGMWSHVTRMWEAMGKAGIPTPKISVQQAADLYAYFGGAAAADKPGDAKRGRAVFEAKLCASCHDDAYLAPTLETLAGKVSAFSMVNSLWEHGGGMLARMVSRNVGWQTLSPQELGDIITYLNAKK